MKISILLPMASLFSFLTGCSSAPEKMLYQSSYNGEKLIVKSHETHNFNGNRVDWRIGWGSLSEIPVNITIRLGTPITSKGSITTDWGPPYNDDIYGGHQRTHFGVAPAYSNKGDDYSDEMQAQHDFTMLYVSESVSESQFRQYATLMKSEWAKVDKALAFDPNINFPHIIGLVHGSKRLFIRSFKGKCHGVPHVLRIDPDGYVNFGLDDGSAEGNHMRHCKVQMPQQAIVLHNLYGWKDYQTTKSEIAKFKNSEGKTPEDFFKLQD